MGEYEVVGEVADDFELAFGIVGQTTEGVGDDFGVAF